MIGDSKTNCSVDNEPEPKRKTLAEKAGEPRSTTASTTSARPTVKGTSLVSASVSQFYLIPHPNMSVIPTSITKHPVVISTIRS